MKRLTRDQRRRSIVLTVRRHRRRLLSKAKLHERRGGKLKVHERSVAKRLTHSTDCVFAPEIFVLNVAGPRRELLNFLDGIQRAVRAKGRVHLNFKRTRRMLPSGTLIFLAVIDRLRKQYSKNPFTCDYPKDRVVEQVMQHVGILDILGKKSRLSTSEFGDSVRPWRFATGVIVEGPKFDQLISNWEGQLAESLSQGLYVGVTEAMTNCVQHAYPQQAGQNQARRWWMFSSEMDSHLFVAFCDLGVGIPVSLSNPQNWDGGIVSAILSALGTRASTDSGLIRASLELRKSSTNLSHRGKGLPQILRVVKRDKAGILHIYSNHGMVTYDASSDAFKTVDFRGTIGGTLIVWRIPLPKPSAGTQLHLELK